MQWDRGKGVVAAMREKDQGEGKSQAALEYVFLIAGAVMFVVFVAVLLRGGVFSSGGNRVGNSAGSLLNASQPYLCWDNFDAEVLDDYEVVSGTWQFSDRKLAIDATSSGSILLDCRLSNFSLSVWVQNNGGGKSMALFRAQNSTDYYALAADFSTGGVVTVNLWKGGTLIDNGAVLTVPTAAQGVSLKLDAAGQDFTVSVNGGFAFSATDDSYSEGQVGFATSAGSTPGLALFDGFQAVAAPLP